MEYDKGVPCVRGRKEAILVLVSTRDNLQSGESFSLSVGFQDETISATSVSIGVPSL